MSKWESFKEWFNQNKKLIIFIAIVIIIVTILTTLLTTSSANIANGEYNVICKDRLSDCLKAFNNYPSIQFLPIPEFYKNIDFEMDNYPHALSDYFYASSYKSYLPCGYTKDIVSYEPLKKVLLLGARMINLDLTYTGSYAFAKDASIIVANVADEKILELTKDGQRETIIQKIQYLEKCKNKYDNCDPSTEECFLKSIDFLACLKLIKDIAWINTNAPLFLFINMTFLPNTRLEYQIYSQLMATLAGRMVDKYYGFQRTNLASMPFARAKNKIIILTNRKPVNSFLDEITNGVIAPLGNVPLYEVTQGEALDFGCKTIGEVSPKTFELTSRNLVAFIAKPSLNDNNIYNRKIDLKNYNSEHSFNIGVCFSFMNWQYFPSPSQSAESGEKNYMKEYFEKFKDKGGMILKPLNMRFIPKPPEELYNRNQNLDFNKIQKTGFGGFMEFGI